MLSRSTPTMLSSWLLLLWMAATPIAVVQGQVEFEVQTDYEYDEPVVFNEWCQQMKDMFGPTCTCTTSIGTSNGIDALDLDHEITCDPLQGNSTCIEGITINSAQVYLKATSVGETGNYQNIKDTVILDFYVFLDDTSIGTTSWRYNQIYGQRRTGCEAVFGAINCPRCGICDAPPNNKTEDGINTNLSPNDIFRGLSGQCRYGNGPIVINNFNTCEDGDNELTNTVWKELQIKSPEESGPCPADEVVTGNGGSQEAEANNGSSGFSASARLQCFSVFAAIVTFSLS